jgi:hypothetical protein
MWRGLKLNKCIQLLQLHFFYTENAFTTTTFGHLPEKVGQHEVTNRYEEEQDLNIPGKKNQFI